MTNPMHGNTRVESFKLALALVVAAVIGASAWAGEREMLYCLHLEGDATNSGTAGSSGISGSANWETNGKFGNQSVKGDSNGYVISKTDGIVTMENGWTLSFWVNPNNLGNYTDACGFKIGEMSYKIERNGGNAFQLYNNGEEAKYPALRSGFSFTQSTWMNIVFVANGSNSFDIYADGTFIQNYRPNGANALGGSGLAAITQISIGTGGLHSIRRSSALVDEVALYNFSASPAEVKCLATYQPSAALCGTKFDSYSASQANASTADFLVINLASGGTFTFDENLTRDVIIVSSGSVNLSADSQPSAEQLAHLDCAGVQGAVHRSWLTTPGVIGFNFNADAGRSGEGTANQANDTDLALEDGTWYKNGHEASGSSTEMFSDGFSTLTWKSANVYAENASGNTTFIQGYLDDGNGGATITLSNVPYETYDLIIYCSTDDSSKSFKAKTVNGTIYTWDAEQGAVVTTNDVNATWGLASAAAGKAVIGANTIRINGLTGPLSIAGGTNSNSARGCISAIQIMPAGTSTTPTLTLNADANWMTADNWNTPAAKKSGNVIINVTGNVTLTVDETVSLGTVTLEGNGSLTLVAADGKTFTASALGGTIPLSIGAGVTIESLALSAEVTWLVAKTPLATSLNSTVYTVGVGTEEAPATFDLTTPDGSMTLADGTFYIANDQCSGTQSTVLFTNATVYVTNFFSVGTATYILAGTTEVTTERLALSQGNPGRTAFMTMKDSAKLNVTSISNQDQNTTAIMFGHWDGPSTFTIQDDAQFNAPGAWVLVGKTGNNQTININGGTFTTKGFLVSSGASETNLLNINGGLLVLGDTGITTTNNTKTMTVTVNGGATISASTATLPISQAMTVNADATLSLTKADDVNAATVQMNGGLSGEGAVSVASGVILDLGTARSAADTTIAFAEGSSLKVTLQNNAEEITIKAMGLTAENLTVYAPDGETQISVPGFVNNEDGTVTIKGATPTWTKTGDDSAFASAENWSTSAMPESGDIVIKVTEDTVIDLGTTERTYDSITISGDGNVSFTGTGTLAGLVKLVQGVKVTTAGALLATSYVLDEGTILALGATGSTFTNAVVISGEGAVETYGNVTFTVNNSFTGGLTVKTGTASTTAKGGFSGVEGDNVNNVTVEEGACLDLANTKDWSHSLTIAGKGVLLDDGTYSGAVKNNGSTRFDMYSRQTRSITLTGDAMVDVSMGWGLVRSGYNPSRLILGGHTLTMRGSGDYTKSTIPLINVNTEEGVSTTGTLIVEGAKLEVVHNASNLAGINIVIKESNEVDFSTQPTAIGSLMLKPSEAEVVEGVTASNWNLPDSFVPSIISGNIDPSGLSVGQELTLLTVPESKSLENGAVALELGTSRYTASASANTATATVKELVNFMHYDFNADGCKAEDSTYNFGTKSFTLVSGKSGKAALLNSNSSGTWYNNNSSGKNPFHAGEMSVTTLVKPGEATGYAIWSVGSGFNDGVALVAANETTFALKGWTNGGSAETIVEVTDVPRLVGSWHFVTVVANQRGTTLYVGSQKASTDAVLPSGISQVGQFGSVHGTSGKLPAPGSDGFLLDDWAVYDTALTEAEIKAIKNRLSPSAFVINIR